MPELPEVETIVRRLREPLIGRTITKVTYDWPRTIGRPAPKEFVRHTKGQTFQSIPVIAGLGTLLSFWFLRLFMGKPFTESPMPWPLVIALGVVLFLINIANHL